MQFSRGFRPGGGALAVLVAGVALLSLPTPGSAQYFGRNKVQYQDFSFSILPTDHFNFYYYPVEAEAVEDVARMGERWYERYARSFQHEFEAKKPVIIYADHPDFQQTNTLSGNIGEGTGGVTESLKNRVIMPLTGSYWDTDHVLGHELVHAFQYNIAQSRRGGGLQGLNTLPLWLIEGMAEYLSVGRDDPLTGMWIRDAIRRDDLPTIKEMTKTSKYFPYRFGQALWAYIGGTYGDDAIIQIYRRSLRVGFEPAIRQVLGMPTDTLSVRWKEQVAKDYLPLMEGKTAPSETGTLLLGSSNGWGPMNVAPSISPDGRYVAAISQKDLFSADLFLADAHTGKIVRKLLSANSDPHIEALRYIDSSGTWSPDGRYFAFVVTADGNNQLVIVDAESGDETQRIGFDGIGAVNNPAWSPDGSTIAFSGMVGGISDLYVWDTRSNEMQRLTSGKYARLHPAWSPDGRTLALATDESPDTDLARLVFDELRLALYHFETGDVELLPGGDLGTNINPVWSPEGESLAFLSDRSGVFNVYLYDLQERNVRRLTDVLTGIMGEGALLTSPGLTWARKADRLAFSYFEEAGFNLYTVDHPRDLVAPESYGPTVTAADEVGRPRVVETVRGRADIAREETDEPSSFYLTEEGFRRSDFGEDALAAGAATGAPGAAISVAALNDSASLALPDTSTLAFRDYTVSLSPDYVGTPTFGATTGGFYGNGIYGSSFVALSDMLGNHNMIIAGAIQGSFDNAQFLTSYAYLKNRLNFGVSFAQYPFFRFLGTRFGEVPDQSGDLGEFNVFERDQFRSVEAIAQYPLSSFARFEFSLSMASIQQDLIFQGLNRTTFENFSITLDGSTRIFFQPEVAYVFDNSLPGFTGPLAGRRMRISGAAFLGDLNMADILVDYRHYHRLPLGATFAQRALSFTRFNVAGSRDVEDFELAWGGPYYLRGYDPGSYGPAECVASEPQSDFDLFCPAQRQVIGSSTLLLNSEVRIPILNPVKDDWLPLNFPPIDLALFFDAGVAFTPGLTTLVWEREPGQDIVAYREPLTSYGASLRMNLFFAVLRIDYTVPRDRGRAFDNGMWTVAFGEMF